MASIPNDPFAKPVLIGGLAILGITVVILLSNLYTTIQRNSTKGGDNTSMYEAAADANIKPLGTVATVDKSVAPVARTGEQVYNAVCTSCHATGVLNAPKLDKADWDARVSKGLEGLLASATNGLNQMPARGGDPSLTDQEITDAILYMTGKAGLELAGGAAPADTPAQAAEPAATAAVQATAPAAPEAPVAPAAPETAQVAAVAQSGIDGEKVYKGLCFSCHDVGVAGSPKLGDKAAWSARIAAGKDSLYNHSINGLNAMPPKGGNPALSDDEIKAAVDWMASQAQ